jgi:flagellar basal body rod protein FlgB
MNLMPPITDNVTEVLHKIIEFTRRREKVLYQNINNVRTTGFVPRDLAVDEFSRLLNEAVDEHIQNRRLVLRDTQNVKFGEEGTFQLAPIVDCNAGELMDEDQDQYLELQINKLLENSLNQRVATQLLRQRQQVI